MAVRNRATCTAVLVAALFAAGGCAHKAVKPADEAPPAGGDGAATAAEGDAAAPAEKAVSDQRRFQEMIELLRQLKEQSEATPPGEAADPQPTRN